MKNSDLKIGYIVWVFDPRLYINDKKTPIKHTVRQASVIRAPYLQKGGLDGIEWINNLIDVKFFYDGHESKAHFTEMVEKA